MGTYLTVEGASAPSDAVASVTREDGTTSTLTNHLLNQSVPTGSVAQLPTPSSTYYKSPPDGGSWSQIVRSGAIKMTDYSHYKVDISYPLARVTIPVAKRSYNWANCENGSCQSTAFPESRGSYTAVYDYHRLADHMSHHKYSISGDHRNLVMERVVKDASSSLDLLTEFSERAGTIKTIVSLLKAVTRPLQSYRDVKKRLTSKYGKREAAMMIADKWLEYRYGIMPIIYSINDALEVLENQNRLYATERASMSSYAQFPNPVTHSLYDTGIVSVRWRATGKARFDSGSFASNLRDQLGINPFVTAWELVPFSFVIDWFLNVGSFIESQTFFLNDFSSERKFCVSTKTTLNVRTVWEYDYAGVPEQHIQSSHYKSYNVGHTFPAIPGPKGQQVVKVHNEERYERSVFRPSDVGLISAPYLDWRRYADGIALVLKPSLKALRRL